MLDFCPNLPQVYKKINGKTSRGLQTYLAPGVLLLPLGDKKFVLAWRTFFKAKSFYVFKSMKN